MSKTLLVCALVAATSTTSTTATTTPNPLDQDFDDIQIDVSSDVIRMDNDLYYANNNRYDEFNGWNAKLGDHETKQVTFLQKKSEYDAAVADEVAKQATNDAKEITANNAAQAHSDSVTQLDGGSSGICLTTPYLCGDDLDAPDSFEECACDTWRTGERTRLNSEKTEAEAAKAELENNAGWTEQYPEVVSAHTKVVDLISDIVDELDSITAQETLQDTYISELLAVKATTAGEYTAAALALSNAGSAKTLASVALSGATTDRDTSGDYLVSAVDDFNVEAQNVKDAKDNAQAMIEMYKKSFDDMLLAIDEHSIGSGGAVTFGGENYWVNLASYDFSGDDFTLMTDVYFNPEENDLAKLPFFGQGMDDEGAPPLYVYLEGGDEVAGVFTTYHWVVQMGTELGPIGVELQSDVISPRGWMNVAVTVEKGSDNTVGCLYVDGVNHDCANFNGPRINSKDPIQLMHKKTLTKESWATGHIDNFIVWSTALSADSIDDIRMTTIQKDEDNLQLYYRFDEVNFDQKDLCVKDPDCQQRTDVVWVLVDSSGKDKSGQLVVVDATTIGDDTHVRSNAFTKERLVEKDSGYGLYIDGSETSPNYMALPGKLFGDAAFTVEFWIFFDDTHDISRLPVVSQPLDWGYHGDVEYHSNHHTMSMEMTDTGAGNIVMKVKANKCASGYNSNTETTCSCTPDNHWQSKWDTYKTQLGLTEQYASAADQDAALTNIFNRVLDFPAKYPSEFVADADAELNNDGLDHTCGYDNALTLESSVIPSNGWHHYAFTMDENKMAKLYVDGSLEDSEQVELEDNEEFLESDRELVFGYIHDENGERFTKGSFDEVRGWSRSQTEADINVYKDRTLPASIIGAAKEDRVVDFIYHLNEPAGVPYVFDAVKRNPDDIAVRSDMPAHGRVVGERQQIAHMLDDGAF